MHPCIKKQPDKHTSKHTQAASLHLRNVTGLLLHSKPTGALNKHLFLPVNPLAFTMLLTRLSQGTQTPCRASCFTTAPRIPRSPPLCGNTPLKAIYTLTFGIQIKKRRQGEAERITVAYQSDSCFARLHANIMHLVSHTEQMQQLGSFQTVGSDFEVSAEE